MSHIFDLSWYSITTDAECNFFKGGVLELVHVSFSDFSNHLRKGEGYNNNYSYQWK
jgi:hypothetical protein